MKKLTSAAICLSIVFSLFNSVSLSPLSADAANTLPAFPGAEGAGKYATGGRGGTIVHVTNLNDSGAGSLRDAVSHTGRIIVFDVGGTINLKSAIIVKNNVTVLGQTAPGGGGITVSGNKMAQGGSNQIIRFVSSRPGERGSGEYDAWGGDNGSNSIIDHCSIGWANDEQWGLYSGINQTVQYSIIGPSNCISTHAKGAHGFGIMFGGYNISWHHNMVPHNISRNFRGKVSNGNPADFVNNVIYDWGYQTGYGTMGGLNYVGNYLKKGPSTKGGNRFFSKSSGTDYEKMRFYVTGNKLVNSDGTDYSSAINNDNWQGVDGFDYATYGLSSYKPVLDVNGDDASVAPSAESADKAFEHVLAHAGAGINAASRPRIDAQVMEEARTGTGNLTGGRDFSSVTDSAQKEAISTYDIKECNYEEYYPPYAAKTITDSDNDGMPDDWELLRGLDPNNASDAYGDYCGQGYMNIEYYANDLTVDAFPAGVVTRSPELTSLGDDYKNAKEDVDSLKLSNTNIKEASDLILPTQGAKGSSISWSSNSSAIVIKNNAITAVRRPSASNTSVTLTASVTNGNYTLKRSFVVTVLSLPTKFDFGGGTVQDGYASVKAATKYSSQSSYGFVDTANTEDMDRAPYNIPSGYDNVYNDQVLGNARFKADMPNGKYTIIIHYGSWNGSFGTNFIVEGVSSGNLASTDAAQYVAEVEITDGVLDVEIGKGNKSYGGYINGLEILTPPDPVYSFDFGSGAAQEGYAPVTQSTLYSAMTGYGFVKSGSQEDMARAPYNIPSGYENLHGDQVQGITSFKADIPNGRYFVTIHYGSWNTGYGTSYIVEGVSSGNLYSTDAAQYTTKIEVKDGTLDLEINKGNKSYGGYINGMDITPIPTLPYHFDFGDGSVQDNFIQISSSSIYSEDMEFGFDADMLQSPMERAPGDIPSGFENLYNDQIQGETVFKVKVPNGKYEVTCHYGSWNTGFATSYNIEGVSSGNLFSTTAAQYTVEAEVTDGMLDLVINKGNKSYGGYINGLEVRQLEAYEPSTPAPTATPTPKPSATSTPAPTSTTTPAPTATIAPASDAYKIEYRQDSKDAVITVPQKGTYCVIFAAYKGGKLEKLETENISFENAGSKATPKKFDIANADVIKVMLWNSLSEITPLCKSSQK